MPHFMKLFSQTILVSIFAIAGILWMASCETTPDTYAVEPGLEYFPLEVGKYIIYEVDSTIFDPTGDTTVYFSKTFVKEEITDTLLDNVGNTLYRVERLQRQADTLPWQIHKVLTLSKTEEQAIRTEDNLRFIKLTFPIKKNNSWNGLVHFDPARIVTVAGESIEMFKNWDYRIESVDEPETIGALNFDKIATLQEADNENNLELRISREKYAKDVGLVYAERWILETVECDTRCTPLESIHDICIDDCMFDCLQEGELDSIDCVQRCELNCIDEYINFINCRDECDTLSWEQKATKGFIMRQVAIDYN